MGAGGAQKQNPEGKETFDKVSQDTLDSPKPG